MAKTPRRREGGGTKRVHPVTSFLTPKKERALRVAARRDLGAALDIMSALCGLGFGHGVQILDCPPVKKDVNPFTEPVYPADLSFVARGDFLLQTTRPPMHDVQQGNRKRVMRSYTDLEAKLFLVWERFFNHCSRSNVRLADALQPLLQPPHDDRRDIKFRESQGAPYMALNNCAGSGWQRTDGKSERRTAAFLLRQDEAWEGGPGLIGAFGMDGTSTAVWGHRLSQDFSHLLAEPGFVMAELVNAGIPARPTNLLWARDWGVTILLHKRDP